ncbi:MAG: site-specific integrase [Rhodospirillaceae bacterium]|nr:site-specific integrase [Rhodospirillaceae bacterium]
MPIFRKPASQAAKAVRNVLALRTPRHDNKDDGKVHSVGTARSYQQVLTRVAEWKREKRDGKGLDQLTAEEAKAYLEERALVVRQKTLDQERQALQILPLVGKLERVKSSPDLKPTRLASEGRAYTPEQVEVIARAQTPRNALATRISYASGVRAHELLTLLPADERPASDHREWSPERFDGRGEFRLYTVQGKGGLKREVTLPLHLAEQLETRRFRKPERVTDRGVRRTQYYDLGGGQAWSQSFSAASKKELGWSTGAHGLRHSYAQDRVDEVKGDGHGHASALETVSQELGHFRPDITRVYLR